MGLQLTAKKSRTTLAGAYVMITNINAQKYNRPSEEVNPETGQYDMTPFMGYTAQAQLYSDQQDRMENFGHAFAMFSFSFEHQNGADPVQEAYAHIHAKGLEGWAIYDVVDLP